MRLTSYAAGRWVLGTGRPAVLAHAITGEPVAEIDSTGLDFAAMLAHARSVGGPALRKLTFHQRALMLKALAAHLMERKEEFYALSKPTGATRTDAWIDVEGGIGTLFAYASKGRRELPNATFHLDGAPEPLSKGGTFVGQHVCVPLEGAAVHINAFNFPAWGMLEKLAPTLLAGMPAIVKPASQTAYVAEAMVRRIAESGILPEGSLQLICGATGDLFEHLTGQDVVTFTGSASTGRRLRAHPRVIEHSVRFTMEADSLNFSLLGPDAAPGNPEFDLFVKEVAREMTVKAGQKCTAIRRAFVPRDRAAAVAEALRDRLARTIVGDPSNETVRMGPLASLGQREEVRARVRELAEAAPIVAGSLDRVETVGADPAKGAFLGPILLRCDEPLRHARVHEIEAFGPVSTLMPYDGTAEAIELAKRGQGSLVGSIFTYDDGFARDVALGVAAHHGRLLLANRDCGKESTGHGSPLPALVHGGPGRAGGGEELGGIRAVLHYMQRTALQGSPATLTAVTGTWLPGAPRRETEVHPFRKHFEELEIGDTVRTGTRTVTLEDIEHFARFTGDTFYAHMDEAAAKANPFFDGRVAHGYLIVSLAAGLFVDPDPGPVLANYGVDNLRFLTPVYPGDTLAGAAHLQAEDRARDRELRRGPLGLHRHQPGRPRLRPVRRADPRPEEVRLMAQVYAIDGMIPVIDPTAFVHPAAILIGDVIVGPRCYVGPAASLRGDFGRLELRAGANLQDTCVMHGFPNTDTVVEEDGHIGHGAVLHGCRIGTNALIGMNAVIMDGAEIGAECIVAAMTFVRANTEGPAAQPGRRHAGQGPAPGHRRRDRLEGEGTATYQALAVRSLRTMQAVEPLTEVEPDRRRLELPGFEPLYAAREKFGD